jgi:hypothetical protein
MNRFLLAIALITAFSAPALAASEKAPTRPHQRHLESTSEHQWKRVPEQGRSGNSDDSYWQPCNSSFHSYIVWDCDG